MFATTADCLASLPELVLLIGVLCLSVALLFTKNIEVFRVATIAISITALTAEIQQVYSFTGTYTAWQGLWQFTGLGIYFRLIICAGAVVLSLWPKPADTKAVWYILFLMAIAGACSMCVAAEMVSIILSIETLSLCAYLMVAIDRAQHHTAEASVKYALFGGVCSAIMFYGLSLIYGVTGLTNFSSTSFLALLAKSGLGLSSIGLLLSTAGMLFKLSAVPFHFYTPDVYEGSQTRTAVFLSIIPKIAGIALFAHFISFFSKDIDGVRLQYPLFNWGLVITCLGIITLFWGNLVAIGQSNWQRLLAYSGIAQSGFLLAAIACSSPEADATLVFYSITYAIATIGLFACLHLLGNGQQTLESLSGLGKQRPFISICATLFAVSLIGLPPFAGFMSKFLLISNVSTQIGIQNYYLPLLIAIAINTVIALFYYLKIPYYLFFKTATEETPSSTSIVLISSIMLLAIATVILGIFPSLLTEHIQNVLTTGRKFYFNP